MSRRNKASEDISACKSDHFRDEGEADILLIADKEALRARTQQEQKNE